MKRKLRKERIVFLLFLLTSLSLPALYIEATTRTRPIVVAVVPKSLDNPMYIEVKEAAEMTARKLNVALEWVAPFKVDVQEQIGIIKGLIRRKVDGIAVSCSDGERLREVIDEAVDAGIKVATMEADAPGSKRLFYCGPDNYQAGYLCGEAVVRIVTEKGWAKRSLQTAILTGGLNAHNLNERIRGFKAATANRINLNYHALLSCDDDTTAAARETEAYIKEHPETEVFFFAGGWVFFGPPESLPLYAEWRRNGGIAVSMNTYYPLLQAAERGFVDFLVGEDLQRMGEFTVSYLVCAIKDLPFPGDFIDISLELADQSNFVQLLRSKKPWDMK